MYRQRWQSKQRWQSRQCWQCFHSRQQGCGVGVACFKRSRSCFAWTTSHLFVVVQSPFPYWGWVEMAFQFPEGFILERPLCSRVGVGVKKTVVYFDLTRIELGRVSHFV